MGQTADKKIELVLGSDAKKQLKVFCAGRGVTMARYIKTALKDRLRKDNQEELSRIF
jgi:hypothetical protein